MTDFDSLTKLKAIWILIYGNKRAVITKSTLLS